MAGLKWDGSATEIQNHRARKVDSSVLSDLCVFGPLWLNVSTLILVNRLFQINGVQLDTVDFDTGLPGVGQFLDVRQFISFDVDDLLRKAAC